MKTNTFYQLVLLYININTIIMTGFYSCFDSLTTAFDDCELDSLTVCKPPLLAFKLLLLLLLLLVVVAREVESLSVLSRSFRDDFFERL